MKRRLWIIAASLICLLLLTGTAFAQTDEELPCGEISGLRWSLDTGSGTLCIAGTEEELPTDALVCAAAVYSEEGQLRQLRICPFPTAAQPEELALEGPLNGVFRLRIFLLNEQWQPVSASGDWLIAVVEPSCTRKGYTSVDDGENMSFYRILPTIGHSWGNWETVEEVRGVEPGTRRHCCTACGAEELEAVYPETSFPILRIYGDTTNIDKRIEIPVTSSFCGAGITFENYAFLKYQGHSSLVYPKKNYTIKFYQDPDRTLTDKYQFNNWNREHKYILRANYVDPSKCRNLVCADLWYEVCKCRDGTKHIKNLFHYGATDGMPVGVYLNDQYLGLFDLTLHKDDDLYDLDRGQEDALMIINQCLMEESLFRAPAVFTDNSDWELEFCGTEDQTWAKEKLNALIDFVMNASDADFADKSLLKQQLNIDSAVDYLLTVYTLGLTNSYAKNLVLLSYGQDPWIFSLFDMEDAFGLTQDGTAVRDPAEALPSCVDGVWDSGTGSLLWDRLLQCYTDRIAARYTGLRQEIFTREHILAEAESRLSQIPAEFEEADRALYPDMPALETDTLTQIDDYLTARLALLDQLFLVTVEQEGGQ